MSPVELIDQIHVAASGEEICFLSPDETEGLAWLDHHPAILQQQVAARRNAAGFYISFPPCLEKLLHHSRSPVLSLDLETTHLTPYSPAIQMTKKSEVGGKQYPSYLARFPSCKIDTRPRIRILAVQAVDGPCPGNYIFDLDALIPEDRQQLIDTVLDGHTIVGHNVIGFDGYWLMRQSDKRPKRWLDTLILTRQMRPDLLYQNSFAAATGSEEMIAVATEALEKSGGKDRASLENIASNLFHRKLNKTYQTPQNWCVSELSPDHYAYVLSDISLPVDILRYLFGTTELGSILGQIKADYRHYITYMRAAEAVANMRGVPFSEVAATAQAQKMQESIIDQVKQMVEAVDEHGACLCPQFGPESIALLCDATRSLNCKAVLTDVEKHAEDSGLKLPRSEKGNISIAEEEMKLVGLDETLPCWPYLNKIRELKKGLGTIEQYRAFAKSDGMIHPQVAFTTEAGRTNCNSPNLQGTPRDSDIRSLIQVADDETIIDYDYSGIELRIAAVNAERAIHDTRYSLIIGKIPDNPTERWYLDQCMIGKNWPEPLPFPSDTTKPEEMSKEDWLKEKPGRLIRYFAQATLNTDVQALTCIFKRGVDVHLASALRMLRSGGNNYTDGDIVEWLASQADEQTDALKKEAPVKAARQLAKIYNFGLLYGMKAFGLWAFGVGKCGLKWSEEEATEGRDGWFKCFPEVGIWHCWTMYVKCAKVPSGSVRLYNQWTGEVETPKYDAKIYDNQTLTGRPLSVIQDYRKILSYQGQGSGADILATAIYKLPPHLKACLILPVHDELLLICKKIHAVEYKAEMKAIMLAAGRNVLGDLVPIEVEGDNSQCWKK
jgi:hypothetical protein